MTRAAVATIIARNYLPQARVLGDSLRRFHPDVPLSVLIIDDDGSLESIGIADPKRFRKGRTVKQIATAVKPRLLRHLTQQFASVLFIDPDSLVVGDLSPLFDALVQHSILLTPHLLAPPKTADRIDRELNIVQSGIYNGGLIGVSNNDEGTRFLTWWRDRAEACCREDVAAGAYYDQRWLDLVPPFFRDVFILRDPGYDVAHWNLPDRVVCVDGDAISVDGHRCRLLHFSGFNPSRPNVVTRYSSRVTRSDIGDMALLLDRYAALLRDAGWRR